MPRDARLLIVGADGTLGSALASRIPHAIRTSRRANTDTVLSLDLTADPETWPLPDRVDVAFLCAAITSIDSCQRFPEQTRFVNVTQTTELARRLHDRGAHVVVFSTNQVFDGTRPRRSSDEPVSPRSVYGRQKAEVEQAILAGGNATVIRFTKVVPPSMPLLRGWVDALRRDILIEPFDDMVLSPVPLSSAITTLIRISEQRPGGIVQVSGEIDVNYAEIAYRLAIRMGLSGDRVRPIASASKGIPRESAPRFTTLDTTRLLSELSLSVPPVASTIDHLIEGILHG